MITLIGTISVLLKIIYYCMKTPNMRLAIAVGLFLLLVDIAIVVLAK